MIPSLIKSVHYFSPLTMSGSGVDPSLSFYRCIQVTLRWIPAPKESKHKSHNFTKCTIHMNVNRFKNVGNMLTTS